MQPVAREIVLPIVRTEPASPLALGLLYAGATAWIYAAVVLVSVLTGYRFEIPNDGASSRCASIGRGSCRRCSAS